MEKKIYANFLEQNIFPVFISFDDFEPGNPMGSHSGQQKLGGLYISIPCLPLHIATALSNVFLVTFFYSKDREKCGNLSVFQELVDELNFLYTNGIVLNINGRIVTVRFKLVIIIGDNLGPNDLFGFQKSFTLGHYCRIYYANSEQCQHLNVQLKSLIRTKQSYTEKNFTEMRTKYN